MPSLHEHIQRLTTIFSRLPGLGERSARRIVLHLLKDPRRLMVPLAQGLQEIAEVIRTCSECGHLSLGELCDICTHPARCPETLCIVEGVSDIWAIERAHIFKGRYHVLGGVLSATQGITPERLSLHKLEERLENSPIREVILALSATLDGHTTAHYIAQRLEPRGVKVSSLGQGIPMGGALDYLDEGTLLAAFHTRRPLEGD